MLKMSSDDIIWGASKIGAAVGLSRRSAYYALESGLLPGTKIGSKWVASRERLLAAVLNESPTPAAQRDTDAAV
jgi:hypothetical protein